MSGLISCYFPHFPILCPIPSHTNTTYQRYEIICNILCPLSRCFALFLDVVLSVCNALLSFLHLATPSDVMRGGPCMSALYPNSRIGWISFPGFPKHHVQTSFSELLSSICLSVIPTGLQFLEGRERSLLLIPLSSLRYTNA